MPINFDSESLSSSSSIDTIIRPTNGTLYVKTDNGYEEIMKLDYDGDITIDTDSATITSGIPSYYKDYKIKKRESEWDL